MLQIVDRVGRASWTCLAEQHVTTGTTKVRLPFPSFTPIPSLLFAYLFSAPDSRNAVYDRLSSTCAALSCTFLLLEPSINRTHRLFSSKRFLLCAKKNDAQARSTPCGVNGGLSTIWLRRECCVELSCCSSLSLYLTPPSCPSRSSSKRNAITARHRPPTTTARSHRHPRRRPSLLPHLLLPLVILNLVSFSRQHLLGRWRTPRHWLFLARPALPRRRKGGNTDADCERRGIGEDRVESSGLGCREGEQGWRVVSSDVPHQGDPVRLPFTFPQDPN
jgi:hypothetical protein